MEGSAFLLLLYALPAPAVKAGAFFIPDRPVKGRMERPSEIKKLLDPTLDRIQRVHQSSAPIPLIRAIAIQFCGSNIRAEDPLFNVFADRLIADAGYPRRLRSCHACSSSAPSCTSCIKDQSLAGLRPGFPSDGVKSCRPA